MQEFIHFLAANWHLTALFLGLLIAVVIMEFNVGRTTNGTIGPEMMTKMINRENAVVFDIRDQTSFAKGHVVGAIIMNQDQVEQHLKKYLKNKEKPLVVVDKDGRNFQSVVAKIKKLGFNQVFGLQGGIDAWRDAGYPLVKDDA